MQQEREAKFLGVDPKAIREKLRALGATRVQPEQLMRRTVFDFSDRQPCRQGSWIRVRDEGDRVTLSFKQVTGTGIEDMQEVELVVDDFERAGRLLAALGYQQKAYQETKREKWVFRKAEITIDTWPGLRPFVEIEASDEETVKSVAVQLDFDYRNALFGSVDVVYERELGITPDEINHETPHLTFENPPRSRR